MPGSQDFAADPRNASLKVWLNGKLVPKDDAKVSIFDAGFVLGDGVWEGLRLHKGALLFLDAHLDRLFAGAKDIALDIGLTRDEMKAALEATLAANGMHHGAHLRLMVTRGVKTAVNQDPRNALGPATIVIVAEYKEPSPQIATHGLALATSSIRCTPARHVRHAAQFALSPESDPGAARRHRGRRRRGADARSRRLRLELQRHQFLLGEGRRGTHVDGRVLLQRRHARRRHPRCATPTRSRSGSTISGWTTSTQPTRRSSRAPSAGITPVRQIDGHVLPGGTPGPITARLRALYEALKDEQALYAQLKATP